MPTDTQTLKHALNFKNVYKHHYHNKLIMIIIYNVRGLAGRLKDFIQKHVFTSTINIKNKIIYKSMYSTNFYKLIKVVLYIKDK